MAVFSYLRDDKWKLYGYAMLQPCIGKSEQKVVFLNGIASYITKKFSNTKSGVFATDAEIIAFAQEAFDVMKSRLGENCYFSQLGRGDVMYNSFEQRMVVNEFENIEAEYSSSGDKAWDGRVFSMIQQFYEDRFETSVLQPIAETVKSLAEASAK